MSDLVGTIANADLYQTVRVTVNGTTIEGRLSPVDHIPEESFRAEIKADDDIRFELTSEYEGDGWTPVKARRLDVGDDDWEQIGEVTDAEVL